MYDYDLLVIGAGPAGEKAATKAAYMGKSVCIVEEETTPGGQCLRGGLPSKLLREAALSYSGARRRIGDLFRVEPSHRLPMEWFDEAMSQLCGTHAVNVVAELERHRIPTFPGRALFADPHTVDIHQQGEHRSVSADKIVIATGSRPIRPAAFPFDSPNVHCTDSLVQMTALPSSMIVVGAGIIGVEYASILATLDVTVHLVNRRGRVLGFIDHEIGDHMVQAMRDRGVRTYVGSVDTARLDSGGQITVETSAGAAITAETLFFSVGRVANTDGLGLEAIDVEIGHKGRPVVDEYFRTSVPHIYAVGDVVGFPGLASSAGEQGRVAAAHAFVDDKNIAQRSDVVGLEEIRPYPLLPYGIYTVPSVSTVGQTEQQLIDEGRDYLVGRAAYKECPRGLLIGDDNGLLKLLCDSKSRKILGVHIVGEQAEELIHIGQACMHYGGTIEYFLRTVFNFPTLASLYKSAAYDLLSGSGPHRHQLSYAERSQTRK
jgi:NAD(P) transhydrogenase